MRKQTKIVAVASAAALLAIGASMTSFAATGWVEEDGQWYYYDSDENRIEDAWRRSGDNWYWLDSEEGGAMAVDKLIEDDDDYYYVDSNGAMVRNVWVRVVNEDQDDGEDPAEYNYYYMQSNGKAYTAGDSDNTRFRTIDGKRYAFDEEGKMLYGWVNEDATRATDESDWETATYYCGNWDDGAMKTGWQKISVFDQDEDDDYDYWFYFRSNGKKRYLEDDSETQVDERTINGKKYGFDTRGVMVYEWTLTASTSDSATSSNSWRYFSNPEDGARATRGWFKVVAPTDEDNSFRDYGYTFAQSDADDEEERWYYADGDGQLYEGEIKRIKGKYYGFRPDDGEKGASMLVGLCALIVKDGEILEVIEDDMDVDDLDDCMDAEGDYAVMYDPAGLEETYGEGAVASLYYFGDSDNEDSDGALKTGSTTINLDGDTYQFQFSTSGGAEGKGRGVSGIDDEKYVYKFGMRLKADSDDRYLVVWANGDIGSSDSQAEKIDSAALRNRALTADGRNKDGESVRYFGTLTDTEDGGSYYLVNTSGSIVKNRTAAKDGNDWYFYVDQSQVKMYTNNNTLNVDSGDDPLMDADEHSLRDDWDNVDVVISTADYSLCDIMDR